MPIDEGPEIRRWMIQPLLDAGLDAEGIEDLTLRLAMHGFSTGATEVTLEQLMALVDDQAPEVQTAWREHALRVQAVQAWKASAPGPSAE